MADTVTPARVTVASIVFGPEAMLLASVTASSVAERFSAPGVEIAAETVTASRVFVRSIAPGPEIDAVAVTFPRVAERSSAFGLAAIDEERVTLPRVAVRSSVASPVLGVPEGSRAGCRRARGDRAPRAAPPRWS